MYYEKKNIINIEYVLIFCIRKKQKKYKVCIKNERYQLLVGSISELVNELIISLKNKLITFFISINEIAMKLIKLQL